MAEKKKPQLKENKLKIDPEKFATAMDKLATDKALQEKLDRQPVDVLEELGIEVDKETLEALKGKSLIEIMGVSEKEAAGLQPVVEIAPITVQPRPVTVQPKPIEMIQPKSMVIQPRSRVYSLTGGVSLNRAFTGPKMSAVSTGPQTGIVVGPGAKEAAAKKKEKKSE